jgi:hypothetical protein
MGPQIGATSVVMDQIASAVVRRSRGKMDSIRAWEPGMIGPDTAPCSTRKNTSESRLQARPQSRDAMVKPNTDRTNTFTTP